MMISGSRVKIIPPFRASHEKKKFSDNVTIFFRNASFTREYTKMKVLAAAISQKERFFSVQCSCQNMQ